MDLSIAERVEIVSFGNFKTYSRINREFNEIYPDNILSRTVATNLIEQLKRKI